MATRDIGENTHNLIAVLPIEVGGLPAHCIQMDVMTSSADSLLFGLAQQPRTDPLAAMVLMYP